MAEMEDESTRIVPRGGSPANAEPGSSPERAGSGGQRGDTVPARLDTLPPGRHLSDEDEPITRPLAPTVSHGSTLSGLGSTAIPAKGAETLPGQAKAAQPEVRQVGRYRIMD